MTKLEKFELNPDIEYVKIHGLQRTATNYVAHMINENYKNCKSLVNIGGWKHGHYCAPWCLGQEVHVVVVTKNPYAWLVSLYKYLSPPFDFDHFVRSPIVLGEPNGSPYFLRAQNPIQHWNNMNFHWMSIRLNEKKVCTIPFENICMSPSEMTLALGNYFSLQIKENLVNTDKEMRPANESPEIGDSNFNKDFYFQKLFLKQFSSSLISFVNEQLDVDLMKNLGYSIEFL